MGILMRRDNDIGIEKFNYIERIYFRNKYESNKRIG